MITLENMGFVNSQERKEYKGENMRGKILLIISLLLMLSLMFSFASFSQSDYLPSDDNEYDALDTLEEEEEESLEKKYDDYINRIRKGDRNVLRLIVYEEFQAVHERIKLKTRRMDGVSYYEYIGKRSSLPAYFAGLENQDPKCRLKCIGYLADYVDEVRADYADILKAANARLASNDETRREVEFALKVLRAKIERRRLLERVKKGDMKVLQEISPDKFLILIANQKRLQIEWCYETDIEANDIVLRSINLDYYAYISNKAQQKGATVFFERLNKEFLTAKIDYRVDKVGDPFKVEAPFSDSGNVPAVLRVLLTGLSNPSLFVREECAYVFLDIVNDRRYDSYRVDSLKTIARTAALTEIIKKAYDDVKYSYYEWADYMIGSEKREWDRRVPTWALDFEGKPEVDKDFRTRPNYVILLKLIMNQTDLEWYHSCEVEVVTRDTDLHIKTLFDETDSAEWRIDELSGEVLKQR